MYSRRGRALIAKFCIYKYCIFRVPTHFTIATSLLHWMQNDWMPIHDSLVHGGCHVTQHYKLANCHVGTSAYWPYNPLWHTQQVQTAKDRIWLTMKWMRTFNSHAWFDFRTMEAPGYIQFAAGRRISSNLAWGCQEVQWTEAEKQRSFLKLYNQVTGAFWLCVCTKFWCWFCCTHFSYWSLTQNTSCASTDAIHSKSKSWPLTHVTSSFSCRTFILTRVTTVYAVYYYTSISITDHVATDCLCLISSATKAVHLVLVLVFLKGNSYHQLFCNWRSWKILNVVRHSDGF